MRAALDKPQAAVSAYETYENELCIGITMLVIGTLLLGAVITMIVWVARLAPHESLPTWSRSDVVEVLSAMGAGTLIGGILFVGGLVSSVQAYKNLKHKQGEKP